MGAESVPRNMLKEYLEGDVVNTRLVFWSQYKEAEERGMLPLLWSQMDARLATIEMIHNGLPIDLDFLRRRIVELTDEVVNLAEDARAQASAEVGKALDPLAPQQLATLLFGGNIVSTERQRVGDYKNGKPKYKNVKVTTGVAGYCYKAKPEWIGKNGKPSTDDSVLTELEARCPTSEGAKLINKVLKYRDLNKQLTTYFEGINSLVMPDGMVHHNLNHCVTATGRLSSSEPNLQNQRGAQEGETDGIKKAFVSRWGPDGFIVEVDYQQLEMVMLAVLSGDKQLLHDIQYGVDMHVALYTALYGRAPTKEQRKAFKPASFGLVYGAGAGAIAAQTGMPKADAKRFIDVFYTRYPGVKAFHDTQLIRAEGARVYVGDKDKETGLPVGRAMLCSWSGRRYVYREYPLPPEIKAWKKKDVGFSPTELKNYPVQGGATADIVPLVLGKLLRVLRNNPELKDKCLMINTVHDSVLFDVHKDVLEAAILVIKATMEAAPTYIKEQFGFEFPLKLKVGVSYGRNWLEQNEISNEWFTTHERLAA
jgi:DNA polymerase-1